MTAVQAAADQVQETADKIDSILQRLPGENTHAQELSSDNVGYQQALLAASNYSESAFLLVAFFSVKWKQRWIYY